jgi:hypothetical protein
MKTSELTGKPLDWAVTKCEVAARGVNADYLMPRVFENLHDQHDFNYSTNWSQGGRIIEREEIAVWGDQDYTGWLASPNEGAGQDTAGPTPLIAAMRCYVASRLGEEIDVPEEL